jgi:hypothetical protein
MKRRTATATTAMAAVVLAWGAAPHANAMTAHPSMLATALGGAVLAQQNPDAASLYAKHLAAIGGADKLRAVTSRTIEGVTRNPATGFVGKLTITNAAPNKSLTRMDAPGVASWETVFDGELGWTIQINAVTTISQGADLDDLRFNSFFNPELEPMKRFAKLETMERATWDGRPAWRVRGTTSDGRVQDTMFDVETGLISGSVVYKQGDKGPVPNVSLITRDYKDFDGLKAPTTLVQRRDGDPGEFVTTVRTVAVNDADPTLFNRPESVKKAQDAGGRWPPRTEAEAPAPAQGAAANPAGPNQPK